MTSEKGGLLAGLRAEATLARQQPLGRRGGHHRGPPVRGLTTQALTPAWLATKHFHLEIRGVNSEIAGEGE